MKRREEGDRSFLDRNFAEKAFDVFTYAHGGYLGSARGAQHHGRGTVCLGNGADDLFKNGSDHLGSLCRAHDVTRNLASGDALFAEGIGDGRSELIDLLHALGDSPDCLDGTPLIDLKPYFASTDSVPEAVVGWHKRKD